MSPSVLFIFPGKLGDACFALATLRAVFEEYRPARVLWVHAAASRPLIEFMRVHGAVFDTEEMDPGSFLGSNIYGYSWVHRDWKTELPGFDYYVNATIRCIPSRPGHLMHGMLHWAGFAPRASRGGPPGRVCDFVSNMRRSSHGSECVVAGARLPQWFLASLSDNRLGSSVQVGPRADARLPNTRDARADGLEACWSELSAARLFIGGPSGLTVFAAVCGVPTIMVHDNRVPYWCAVSVLATCGSGLRAFDATSATDFTRCLRNIDCV